MNICMICDNGYVMPTQVVLASLKRLGSVMSVYILVDRGFKSKELLEDMCSEGFSVSVMLVVDTRFRHLHRMSRNSNGRGQINDKKCCSATKISLFKFLISEVLYDIDKVLFLDGDMIVRKSIESLYATDVSSAYMGVVVDGWIPISKINKNEEYFNSGMMLMNLSRMRAEGVSDKLIKYKQRHPEHSMDNTPICSVCAGNVVFVDVSYNFMTFPYERYGEEITVEEINRIYGQSYNDISEMAVDPVIVHWAGKFKPWNTDGSMFQQEWKELYETL